MNPLVSVIIPVYNKETTVARAIESVLNQTWKGIEVIVVDDGSTDDSKAVVLDAIKGCEGCILVEQENSGVAAARNNGVLRYSHGDFIMCLDSDDAIEPGYVEYLATELMTNPTVDIVYTMLYYFKPDGSNGASPWPNDFDRDGQFRGKNQVPTAAMSRRRVWTTLGGQRSRYCPGGAGSEDAEFWLRAISYGHGAKFLPGKKGAMFLYSWMSGYVTGNKDYREIDWRGWAPWCSRWELMPTPSMASASFFTHAARYYDEPGVSVIIPVGPGHYKYLVDALDSLDAQTYKHWEAIVVFDVSYDEWLSMDHAGMLKYFENTWPAVRWMSTNSGGKFAREMTDELDVLAKSGCLIYNLVNKGAQPAGAGAARNAGIARSRASLLFFLDADDYLMPDALEKMINAYTSTGKIIFSEHYGIAYIKEEDLERVDGKVVYQDKITKPQVINGEEKYRTVVHQRMPDFDCRKALEQPYTDGRPPYIICSVSSLVPKKWAKEVGLFPETWESWEDVLFFWSLAWSGRCFHRIDEPLLVYRYYTGERREQGLAKRKDLLARMKEISEGTDKKMGCGCGGASKNSGVLQTQDVSRLGSADMATLQLSRGARLQINDEDMVLVEFRPQQTGDRDRFGPHDFGGGNFIKYGRKSGGEQFYVHINDLETEQNLATAHNRNPEFVVVAKADTAVPQELEPVEEMDEPEDLGWLGDNMVDDDRMAQQWLSPPEWEKEEDIFPEPVQSLGRLTPLGDLDVDMKNPDRYVVIFMTQDPPIETVLDLMRYEEEYEEYGGIGFINGIGPAARKAFLDAARKLY